MVKAPRRWCTFKQARAAVRKLKLKRQKEWSAWSKTKRPANIPGNPHKVYRDSGWVSWPDFLGYKREFLSFKQARAAVRKLKFRSQKEWHAWSKTKRPVNIPGAPHKVYRDSGWVSFPDFLGYKGNRVCVKKEFLPFKQARAAVWKCKHKSKKEWYAWSKTERPANIPGNPHKFYRDSGWVSLPDFLGYKAKRRSQHGASNRGKYTSTREGEKKLGSRKRKHKEGSKPEEEEEENEEDEDGDDEGEGKCCPSCLDDLSDVSAVRTLPCNHIFCGPCLDAWARRVGQEEGSRSSRSSAGGARSVLISCPTCRDRSRFVYFVEA